MYDLVIIGSGPAGMAAAVYAARAELDFIVVEKGISGGQILETSDIDNYPGYPSISGFDLAEKFRAHAEACGTEIIEGMEIEDFKQIDGGFELLFDGAKTIETKTILIATGANPRRLGCPGEEELIGAGVSYCATCDGAFFSGKDVAVVGIVVPPIGLIAVVKRNADRACCERCRIDGQAVVIRSIRAVVEIEENRAVVNG